MRIVDLSKTLDEGTLTYPGDEGIRFRSLKNASDGGWNLSCFRMGSHSGTHVDSPLHLVDGGKPVSEVPVERFCGPCVVLDLTGLALGEAITAGVLEPFEGDVEEGDVVVFKTKNSFLDDAAFREDFVYLAPSGAELLVARRIKGLAIDYLSVGPRETHEILLGGGVTVFENVTCRAVVPGRYFFVGLPIKLALEGAPARVILIENFTPRED